MRTILLILTLGVGLHASAQWTASLSGSAGARKDDIFFIGTDTGWVAGGADGEILRTYDGGQTWDTVYTGGGYLRSIEFCTPLIGFCGTLDDDFLRTTDGGDTWTDISAAIAPPSGICGLCAPTSTTVYGVGVWSEPAYLLKSTDAGNTWTKSDLSSMASSLVDVYFLNADTGFVSGMASPSSLGGVVLATVDGGTTWEVRHLTGQSDDYIWKLQSPDNGAHIYGSIEALQGLGGTRFVRSMDAGATWATETATTEYHYNQVIGFLNTLHGWMGAITLLETLDGGATWQDDAYPAGTNFDRFQKISETEAFMSGKGVYKYGDISTGSPSLSGARESEQLRVEPNPAAHEVRVSLHLLYRSRALLILYAEDGSMVRRVFDGTLNGGDTKQTIDLSGLASGVYRLVLRTNQGQCSTSIVKG